MLDGQNVCSMAREDLHAHYGMAAVTNDNGAVSLS